MKDVEGESHNAQTPTEGDCRTPLVASYTLENLARYNVDDDHYGGVSYVASFVSQR